ncbi:unnamed protein product [Didymodactylos carnosus]|uniref:SOCS box domain-containing protein n=1 Tax=Didymodactylos carnosus TaxID=1234261 RepID=A0A814ZJQ9_9BILA|nr:unnamed protein product [Didymodactylos carnosus]CAF1242788.1 unnamed protein product [Didymodactylos carnosus]CAF3822406.1 unnamed protein product [Didymodactylos carnosus]CAF4006789.1 unnamed protein product [Didymodactylos carnosus]
MGNNIIRYRTNSRSLEQQNNNTAKHRKRSIRRAIRSRLHHRPKSQSRPASYAGHGETNNKKTYDDNLTRPLSMIERLPKQSITKTVEQKTKELQEIEDTSPNQVKLRNNASDAENISTISTPPSVKYYNEPKSPVHFELKTYSSYESGESINDLQSPSVYYAKRHNRKRDGLYFVSKSYQLDEDDVKNGLESIGEHFLSDPLHFISLSSPLSLPTTTTTTTTSSLFEWKSYTPFTLEKLHQNSKLKEYLIKQSNDEYQYILEKLLKESCNSDDQILFSDWFLDEIEFNLRQMEETNQKELPPILTRTIEDDQFDCMNYILDKHLLPNKFDINKTNDQGRHCLLMLTHKNDDVQHIKYLIDTYPYLDKNKYDLNRFSCLHHSCRHFNLDVSLILLPYLNKEILQLENSECHTPLDYWFECLCSLKKRKTCSSPTPNNYLTSLSDNSNKTDTNEYFKQCLCFLQNGFNKGGQLSKMPASYLRSSLKPLSLINRLQRIEHYVTLWCLLYKNRLSTLLIDYDHIQVSIKAGEILTELAYVLIEVHDHLVYDEYRNFYEHMLQRFYSNQQETENNDDNQNNQQNSIDTTVHKKQFEQDKNNMQLLYFKFFRLFECIYNNPDVSVNKFHFQHIFRRAWIHWKTRVELFTKSNREKQQTLKMFCRKSIFKCIKHYPGDIKSLPISNSLKRFLAYDNQFFLID